MDMELVNEVKNLADEIEENNNFSIEKESEKSDVIENASNDIVISNNRDIAISAQSNSNLTIGTNSVLSDIKSDILFGAKKKVDNEKTKEKHSKKLAIVADDAIETEIEMQQIEVERQKAQNKADKQEIANRLYVLKQEHKREIKEQKQLNAAQKMEHRKRNKEKKWETYGKSLTQLGYDYVPNPIILATVLALVGTKAFFNGLSKTGDAMVKALKWVFMVGGVLILLLAIPVTRIWLLDLLGFIKK